MNTKSPETIQALEQQLGIPGKYGSWWMARKLLQECWKHKPHVIRDATVDLRGLPFLEASRDILWRRELEPYMIGWTVHHFDKNSQYLSACSSTDNGIGTPVHLTGDHRPGAPGIYRVTNVDSSQSDFGDYALPPIIEPGQEWVTNDVMLFAWNHGYTFTVTESWVFWDYARILGNRNDRYNWSKKIWTARQFFKAQGNMDAYHEMKNMAVVGVGSFATNEDTHPGIDLIHPNWWADTVGSARIKILANLLKYGSPVLIETDGVYYVTRDANPRIAIPGILDRMTELGGYKHEGSCTLTQEMYEQSIGASPRKLAVLFKRAGGEK